MLETDLRFAGYSENAARAVYDELLRRIQAIPGVESAALLRGLPMEANGVPIVVDRAAGEKGSEVEAAMIEAGPGFFDTLRIPLLYGRVFDARDRADTPRVAVITDRMARQYFGALNAVGRRFRLQNDPNSWTEVIGVVRDTGTGDFDDDVLDPIAPPFYTFVHAVRRAADDDHRADVGGCGNAGRGDAARTARRGRHAAGGDGEDDGAELEGVAGGAESGRDVSRRPRRPRPGAGQHRSLCGRLVCRGKAVA